jgi:transcriptional regulator with XRE-family HTH domain
MDDLTHALAATLAAEREARDLSVSALAERSGVSRAMIGKIERGEAQPTAALLGRLSAALELTLSELLARAEDAPSRLARHADQPTWTDPETGFVRRTVSPPAGGPLQLVEVELPPGARVAYPADAYTFVHEQLWVLAGRLQFTEGDATHDLGPGDAFALGEPAACVFHNPGARPARYLVALTRR